MCSSFVVRERDVCQLTHNHILLPNDLSDSSLGHAPRILPAVGGGVLLSSMTRQAHETVDVAPVKTSFSLVADIVLAFNEKELVGEGRCSRIGRHLDRLLPSLDRILTEGHD